MGIEDKLNQAKGALKEGAGKLTGDKKTEVEGAVEKVVAKAKDGIEDVKAPPRARRNCITSKDARYAQKDGKTPAKSRLQNNN